MYDCTFYVENDFDVSIAHWLKGNPSTITLVCSRIDLSDIPTDPDESKAYLNQLFHEKVPSPGACSREFGHGFPPYSDNQFSTIFTKIMLG